MNKGRLFRIICGIMIAFIVGILIVLFVRNEPSNSFFFRDEKLYNYFTDNSNVGCVATSVSVIEKPF